MNEEEKKAIETLNTFEFRGKTRNYKEISLEDSKSVKIVLNLLEKLQKENEKLKSNNEKYTIHLTDKQYNAVIENAQNDINQKWIQKVKDRIEKYKKLSDKFYVKFLESDRYNTDIREKGIKCDAIILALEELIEEREEKAE